ncbi:MAG: hypothetical protein E7398_00280 [Ruminococcaceae bacterium]|nr:hypothetical protein [Oscillospiraceae bacterium]
MTALVTVAGTPLPEPSEYSSSTSTLVDSARNVEGKVVGSVVRPDVAKIELKWRYLTAQQWASVLSLFTNNFYNSVTFFNQTTAGYTTRDMYVGDRSAGMWRRNPTTGEVMGFTDCSLNLIEV